MMSTLFYRQARLTALTVLLIVVAGLGALLSLGRQEDPTLSERFAFITTDFPGASAERVEALVTEPIEDALLELPEVKTIDSRTRAGVSIVTVELRDDLGVSDIDRAWSEVRDQLDTVAPDLPDAATDPDLERRLIAAATLLVALTWEGPGEMQPGILSRLATELEDQFQNLPGTEETDIWGEVDEEVRVVVDLDRLAAIGLTPQDVARLIERADAKTPGGSVRSDSLSLGLEVAGEIDSLDRVRETPLAQTPDGDLIRVADVAQVEKAFETPPASWAVVDGERAVLVAAIIQPGLQADAWTQRALAALEYFMAQAPGGVGVDVVFKQADYVALRLMGLGQNLLVSAGVVFLVLFVLMGWRAAIVVGLALPLTALLVLILIQMIGQPLHQMSVTGLVIALGLLIDNAIVMTDEFQLMRRRGASPLEAIDKAVRHLFAPLLASTVTTMLAFAPIALMPGGAGEFVGMIGVSVMFAVGSSLVLAMTVLPAIAAWFDSEVHDVDGPFWRSGLRIKPLVGPYRAALSLEVRRPWVGLVVGVLAPVLGFALIGQQPVQFFPQTERDMIQVNITLDQSASLEETRQAAQAFRELAMGYDGVEQVAFVVGESPPRTYYNVSAANSAAPNFAGGFIKTRSPQATHDIVIALQRAARSALPQAQVLVLPFEQGPPADAPVELVVRGPDVSVLQALGDEIRAQLSDIDRVTYTSGLLEVGAPVAKVAADEAAADRAGLRLEDIAEALRAQFDGATGGALLEDNEELPVRVIADEERRGRIDAVSGLVIPTAERGDSLGLPLAALGPVRLEPEVAVIPRQDGERINAVYGHLEPFSFADDVLTELIQRLDAAGFALPPGYTLSVGGEAENRGDAVGNLFGTAAPLMVAMLATLVLAFNSFRYAGVIALVGVLSVGLAFLGLWLFDQPLGFNAIVGAMGLVGLAINGSIVVLSALRADKASNDGDRAAMVDTIVDATRHIVATTLTTISGFAPLILSGDAFWLPLATAIAGGVAGSALLALFFAPACFVLIRGRGFKRRRAQAALTAAAPAE
ncbi:MAG: efflux RND transporter permease subunit [Maricaulaceae bacterium]